MARDESLATSLTRDTTSYLCYLLFIATLGPLQFGFHLAELNAPQEVITCAKKSILSASLRSSLPQCIPMKTEQFAIVSSIYTLGGLLGALSAGSICNKYGRLLSMRATTTFFVLGPLFETFAVNIGLLAFGRFISGIGAGATVVVVPIYISEIAPPKGKGFFGAFTQIMINIGILITQLLGYFLSRNSMWRIILATAGGIGLFQLVGLLFVPESPKWLAEHHHPSHARSILRKIRGYGFDIDEEVNAWNVNSSSDEIYEEESLLNSREGVDPPRNAKIALSSSSVGMLGALMHAETRPAIIAVIAVMVAQQLTGINSIVMYSVSILSALLPTTAALLTVAVSALNVIVSVLCAPLSDKLGRKTCLLLSIAGMGTNSVLLAVGISYSIKLLSAIAILLFVASFAVGLGPVPFILANELVGAHAVGATQSWALAANWIATFLVSQFFPMLNEVLGKGRVYYVFAALALAFGLFISWWVPETKGKHGADEVWGRKEIRERVE